MAAGATRIGSLFSGIGGLERGLEMCGLGNSVVPQQAALAFRTLIARAAESVAREAA
jgi:hypothetical protein